MYQNVKEGKFISFVRKRSKSSKFYYLEAILYFSLMDIFEAMNTLIQERHNHSENCITAKVSGQNRKVEIYVANERSGLTIFREDLHTFSVVMLAMILE